MILELSVWNEKSGDPNVVLTHLFFVIFQFNTKYTKAEKQLSNQGRKAMVALRKKY